MFIQNSRRLVQRRNMFFIRCWCLFFASIFDGLNMLENLVNAAYIAKACRGIRASNMTAVIIAIGCIHAFSYDRSDVDRE